MRCSVNEEPGRGRVLRMTDGETEVGAALDYGLRIVHLSAAGMENLFYQQPADLSDGYSTEQGWRLRGGHRFWLSPESERSYWPDNDPVTWTREGDGILLTQEKDAALGVRKSIRLRFLPEGGVELEHRAENVSRLSLRAALWGVNTLDGGTATIPFAGKTEDEYTPHSVLSLWGDTCLGDPRFQFTPGLLTVRHLPSDTCCKLGLYSRAGRAVLENKGQRLEITFPVVPPDRCADLGCNFEVYLSPQMLELETLGPLQRLSPGRIATHTERWRVTRI